MREVTCDNDWVFSGLRKDGGHIALALISLSDKPQKATIHLNSVNMKLAGATLIDPVDGRSITLPAGETATIDLKPFQTWVGRLP